MPIALCYEDRGAGRLQLLALGLETERPQLLYFEFGFHAPDGSHDMSNKDRRPSSTSHAAEHALYQQRAAGPPPVPASVRLRAQDLVYWRLITAHEERVHWGESHLHVAAQLARVMTDIDHEQRLLDDEGFVSRARGRPVVNPRAVLIDRLIALQLRLLRRLGIIGWRRHKRIHVLDEIPAGGLINTL